MLVLMVVDNQVMVVLVTFPNYTGNLMEYLSLIHIVVNMVVVERIQCQVNEGTYGGAPGAGGGGTGAYRYPQSYGSPAVKIYRRSSGAGQWYKTTTSGGDGGQGMVVIRYLQVDVSNAQGTST